MSEGHSYHIYYFKAAVMGGTLSPDDLDGAIHEAVWMAGARLCECSALPRSCARFCFALWRRHASAFVIAGD